MNEARAAVELPLPTSDPAPGELLSGFVAAVRRLEASHARLRERADAIDVELAASNERLRDTLDERERLFAALPVGVVAVDPRDGSTIWANPEAERLRPILRAAGHDWCDVPAGDSGCGESTLRVRRAPLPQGGELVVLEDQTRVVGLEREVERLDRLAGLSELALGVAHEIKNPLNGVLGYASLIERSEDPERIRGFARRIAEGLRAVDAIVRDMLAFARPVRDPRAAVAATVGEVLTAAAVEVGLPGDHLQVQGDHGLRCDRAILGRVLVNLLRNSCEASAPRVPRVTVEARVEAGLAYLRIADDGPGIDAELAERLFEPFVSSRPGSRGLGLALTARVLSYVGGRIGSVAAERGACFEVRLPVLGAGEEVAP